VGEWERREGLPYADGTTTQTGPNEAAELGVGPIEAYPTLRLLLLLLVVLFVFVCIRLRGHRVESVRGECV
jgi:hypothetical protein